MRFYYYEAFLAMMRPAIISFQPFLRFYELGYEDEKVEMDGVSTLLEILHPKARGADVVWIWAVSTLLEILPLI